MRLHEPDGSLQVALARDDVLELDLADLPGAGYLWQVEVSGPLSVPVPSSGSGRAGNGSTGDTAPPADAVGAGATRLWRVAPTGPGIGMVTGARSRPWEPERPDRSFTVEVRVG